MGFNIFQHEDALTLGMLFYTHIMSKFKLGLHFPTDKMSSYSYTTGKGGTGRGGWYYDQNGDDGRIPLLDAKTGGSCLAGKGATRYKGGQGLHPGTLGQGGDGTNNSSLPLGSAGGGAGKYGGGSSFMRAGGSGGYSGCPAAYVHTNQLTRNHDRFDPDEYDVVNEPEQLHHYMDGYTPGESDPYHSLWNVSNVYEYSKKFNHPNPFKKGYDGATLEEELEMLLELNTAFHFYYLRKYQNKMSYWSWDEWMNLISEAAGNGYIIISKPNEKIHWKHLKSETIESVIKWARDTNIPIVGSFGDWVYKLLKIGKLEGIGKIVLPKDGWTQEITFEPGGVYEILLYGASGGNIGQWSPFDESYAGGFGGNQLCVIDLSEATEPLTLYAVLGERGKGSAGVRAFNGGGAPSQGCTGGGGASDLRYSPLNADNTLLSRIAIAGGGGGIYGELVGSQPPVRAEDQIPTPMNGELKDESTSLFRDVYKVNDQSLVRVEYDLVISEEDSPVEYDLTIEIDDGQEGTMTQTVTIESSGHQVIIFDLGEIYPPDTPTHQVTIDCIITKKPPADPDEELPYMGVSSDILVYVDTKLKDNESQDVPRNPILLNCGDTFKLDDAVEFVRSHFDNIDLEASGTFSFKDNAELVKSSSTFDGNMEQGDTINLTDEVETIVTRVNKIVLEAGDTLTLTDDVYSEFLYLITVSVDPNAAFGTVCPSEYYPQGASITLWASPIVGYSVEWWKDGVKVGTGEELVINITDSCEYIVKFIMEASSDIPYITDGLIASFDFYLNKKDHLDLKATVWQNLLEGIPTFSIDSRGFVDDGIVSAFDGIDRGTSDSEWIDTVE